MAKQLGMLKKIDDLRLVWPHEANDFSRWLAQDENFELLKREIGIEMSLLERESAVGQFSVDLFAEEDETGRKIVIENQLEDTDHDHLGKIITYASGKEAEVVIWIVKHARDEHRQAIECLNKHTDENIGFFLLEIELWRIDDSNIAPKFNIVERPNEWGKVARVANQSEKAVLYWNYWTAFCEYAFAREPFRKVFSQHKPNVRQFYDLRVGFSTLYIVLRVTCQKKSVSAGIYIKGDRDLYNLFLEKRQLIEERLGCKAEFPDMRNRKDYEIRVRSFVDICSKQDEWEKGFQWQCTTALLLRELIYEIAGTPDRSTDSIRNRT